MDTGYICRDCPRKCGVWRGENTAGGFCGCRALPQVVRAAPHFGEEPCISGTMGSGTVFFSGCNLRCVFCQHREISRVPVGQMLGTASLRDLLIRLRDQGVHNINLVTPTHYARVITEALTGLELGIPVVWNSSGYESVETLRRLEGLVQIYMPDYKYADPEIARRYSTAPDYPCVAAAAISEMFRQTGPFVMDDNGLLKSGVLIRHLILPGFEENTMNVIDYVADSFPHGSVLFSLMSQYTPMQGSGCFPELQQCVSAESNELLCHYMKIRKIETVYWQDPASATGEMIPDFHHPGII